MTKVAVLVLAAILVVPSSLFGEDGAKVLTIDHLVPHVSTVPANAGDLVNLFVRERVRECVRESDGGCDNGPRKAVLMIHGASVSVLPGMDLRHDHYDWALWLAQAGGFDVFMLDFQGSGLSPRPKMDDPCNIPLDQQSILIPNPLPATCPPSYPFQLINSQSDWSELDAVVDYIRNLRGLDKVALVSWSNGSFRIGPYAVQHPDKVESLLFLAPIYNPAGRAGTGPDGFAPPAGLYDPETLKVLPQLGPPMSLTTRSRLMGLWNPEIKCEDQAEEGIQDVVWSAIMDSDPIGRNWGPPPAGAPAGSPPEGVMRVRSFFPVWGWNSTTVRRLSVPVLIIVGTLDTLVEVFPKFPNSFFNLYETIPHNHKLLFRVDCAGHFMVWERQRRVLHHISKEWLKHGAVDGCTRGKFFVDTEGAIFPQDPQDPVATCE